MHVQKRSVKKWLSMLMVVALSFSMFSSVGAASSSDLDGHWAKATLIKWVESDLIKGYEDGSIKPDKEITRGEFVALVNRSFGLQEENKEVSFSDVPQAHWVYTPVSIAVEEGYVSGYPDQTFRPSQPVTREQSALMVSKLLKLGQAASSDKEPFSDILNLSTSSQSAILSLYEKGIIKGYSEDTFGPEQPLTRAQAVTMLDTALNQTVVYDKAGEYGPESDVETIYGHVVVAAADVTLKNVVVTGNLTVAKEVGDGDVHFKGVRVKGETFVQGGGENSVHFEDSVILRITVNKTDGSVRVVVAGASTIQHVLVQSPAKLEESFVTDTGFSNVDIGKELPSGSQVELLGQFENVSVISSNIKVNIPKGSVNSLNVQAGANDNKITIDKEASVLKLILDTITSMLGQGKIEDAVVNRGAQGSNFETQPSKVDGAGAVQPSGTPDPNTGGSTGPVATPKPSPSTKPSESPSESPSTKPSESPSESPSTKPSESPSESPSTKPSESPSESPSTKPSESPSESPSTKPSESPSESPSTKPSESPSESPSTKPSESPSESPSTKPSESPSESPSTKPSESPSESPNPSPEPCGSDECKMADLKGLAVGDFTLNQLDWSYNPTGILGFDPNVFTYSVVNDVEAPTTFELSIVKPELANATYNYTVTEGNKKTFRYGDFKNDVLALEIKPHQDLRISITVTSGDGKRDKYYSIIFYHPRSIQEAFKIERNNSYNINAGTWTNQYALRGIIVNGIKLLDTDLITVYRSQDDRTVIGSGTYKVAQLNESELSVAEKTGSFYVEVTREDSVLAEGIYNYDFTPIERITKDVGISIVPFTKQELIEEFINKPYLSDPLSSGAVYYYDFDKIREALPNAKYYMDSFQSLYDEVSDFPDAYTLEQVKLGVVADGFSGPPLSNLSDIPEGMTGTHAWRYIHNFQSEYGSKEILDQFISFIFFDEEFNAIGYIIIPVTYDEDHVADGYKPKKTWKPTP
ncbi:S-layer homology domain-containing protein [Paenibacillus sp. 1011MAR3C5]|uniref:S-layer homology domain-containing protein n=1 Tax=Paenibacillus sp. 1011MAR3C5 TaxID=1675787 RepID=UPI0015FFFA58|nr:S-layer homology domain-containing protein [Paenibacillus sp. 1011MAR3C5]